MLSIDQVAAWLDRPTHSVMSGRTHTAHNAATTGNAVSVRGSVCETEAQASRGIWLVRGTGDAGVADVPSASDR